MEFVQFHPTALKLPNLPPFLISEAIRGEGAHLINSAGERFVDELAPRDVVARAIYERLKPDQGVFLDLRHLPPENIRKRFPHISVVLPSAGLRHYKAAGPCRSGSALLHGRAAHRFARAYFNRWIVRSRGGGIDRSSWRQSFSKQLSSGVRRVWQTRSSRDERSFGIACGAPILQSLQTSECPATPKALGPSFVMRRGLGPG